jgi:hypothetical protein
MARSLAPLPSTDMNDGLKKRVMILLTGCTGSGKSVMLKKILRGLSRWILLDTMNEYGDFPGLHLDNFPDLIEFLKNNRRANYRVILSLPNALEKITLNIPDGGAYEPKRVTSCEFLCMIAFQCLQNSTIVIEELGKFDTRKDLAPWLYNIVCLGRHRALSVIATTQRPAQIATDFKAQINKLIVFKQHLENDIEGLRFCIGNKEQAQSVRDLKPFVYGKPMKKDVHYKEFDL